MKNLVLMLFLFSLAFAYQGCEKDNEEDDDQNVCAQCAVTPEAKAAYDESSAGVYKGIVTGSSGTLVFYVGNEGNEIKALLAFDGKSAVLTSQSFADWTPGEAITDALFTGTLDNQAIQATFSVSANGLNPSVNLSIPGHSIYVAVFKETSEVLVKSFEGRYTGDETGALNILFSGDEFTVLTNGQVMARRTKLVNGKIQFTYSETKVAGEFITEDLLKGTWQNQDGEKGTWEAKRTL